MQTQMIVRIDTEIKNKLSNLARVEKKTTSQVVRELIEEHIKERDIGAHIDDLWNRIGIKLKTGGVTQEKISKAIKGVREKRK